MSSEDVGAVNVGFSSKSGSDEGLKTSREFFILEGGYMSIFEDDEKEPAYNYLHILY